jgi:hypothetical protein
MAYQAILERAWNVLRRNLFLIGLGVLVTLGNGGGSSGSNANATFSGDAGAQGPNTFPGAESGQFPPFESWALPAAIVGLLLIIGLVFGLIIFVLSSVARGGLVDAVNTIEEGAESSFGLAWNAGWSRLWTLLGIGIIPAIPVLLGVLLLLASVGATIGFGALFDISQWDDALLGAGIFLSATLLCILVPLTIVLSLLRTFAVRACMLEGRSVWDSYSRGWSVATANLGSAIIFFLIQIGISIVLGLILFVPSIIGSVCCFLWPIFLLIGGTVDAYFSAMWTLVWRDWMGMEAGKEIVTV